VQRIAIGFEFAEEEVAAFLSSTMSARSSAPEYFVGCGESSNRIVSMKPIDAVHMFTASYANWRGFPPRQPSHPADVNEWLDWSIHGSHSCVLQVYDHTVQSIY
jgi:hypothetical protein